MSETSALLQLENVSKTYPVSEGLWGKTGRIRAVDRVTLSAARGEVLGLVGESGCGKSTLGRLILGLEEPDSGTISYGGTPVSQWNEKALRRKIQMVFQDPFSSLNPRKTIGSAIGEGLVIHGIGTRAERAARVQELLKLVGLSPAHAKRYPHEFSGGQRQRVAVARALALNPELVVCDEPVSALDVSIQAQVLNLLRDLKDEFGLTYVFISHDLAVVGHLCDRVAVMYLGALMELADRRAVFEDPKHPYTRALLSAVPVPDPERKSERVVLGGDPPSPVNPPTGCPFHPRCPEAMEICTQSRPNWQTIAPGRKVACHLHQPME